MGEEVLEGVVDAAASRPCGSAFGGRVRGLCHSARQRLVVGRRAVAYRAAPSRRAAPRTRCRVPPRRAGRRTRGRTRCRRWRTTRFRSAPRPAAAAAPAATPRRSAAHRRRGRSGASAPPGRPPDRARAAGERRSASRDCAGRIIQIPSACQYTNFTVVIAGVLGNRSAVAGKGVALEPEAQRQGEVALSQRDHGAHRERLGTAVQGARALGAIARL